MRRSARLTVTLILAAMVVAGPARAEELWELPACGALIDEIRISPVIFNNELLAYEAWDSGRANCTFQAHYMTVALGVFADHGTQDSETNGKANVDRIDVDTAWPPLAGGSLQKSTDVNNCFRAVLGSHFGGNPPGDVTSTEACP